LNNELKSGGAVDFILYAFDDIVDVVDVDDDDDDDDDDPAVDPVDDPDPDDLNALVSSLIASESDMNTKFNIKENILLIYLTIVQY
jgi:hypothetical protein